MADKKVTRSAWAIGRVWKGVNKDGESVEVVILKDSEKINYKFVRLLPRKETREFPHRHLLKYFDPTEEVRLVDPKWLTEK